MRLMERLRAVSGLVAPVVWVAAVGLWIVLLVAITLIY